MCAAAGCASSKYSVGVDHLAAPIVSLESHCVNNHLCWKTEALGRCRQTVEKRPGLVRLGFPLVGRAIVELLNYSSVGVVLKKRNNKTTERADAYEVFYMGHFLVVV